jgi:hypothetical protein
VAPAVRHQTRRPASRTSAPRSPTLWRVSPFWLWIQVVIVAFTLAGMVIAIVKLA